MSVNVKDAGTVGLLAGLTVLFGLNAKDANPHALSDAAYTAVNAASIAAPAAGSAIFILSKLGNRRDRENAALTTIVLGGAVTIAAAGLAAFTRLALDIMQA